MTSTTIRANVNPDALKWARDVLRMPLSIAAKKIGVSPERLAVYETGEERPTVRQLREIGRVYRKPAAFFYLRVLPEWPDVPHDYRRLPDSTAGPSPELLDAVFRAQQRREDAIELSGLLGESIPKFDVSVTGRRPDVPTLARQLRTALGVTTARQRNWKDYYAALRGWSESAERAGVLVLQFSGVDVQHARGFSLAERPFPVAALNGSDSPGARIFTLLHELAHVALGAAGVCDLHSGTDRDGSVEVYCNEVAGEALVPREDLLAHDILRGQRLGPDWSDQDLTSLARRYWVNREVILRRLLVHGWTTGGFYDQWRERDRGQREAAERGEKGGGFLPPHRKILRDNGRVYTSIVLQAYASEMLSGLEVSRLFDGVKLQHLDAIRSEL